MKAIRKIHTVGTDGKLVIAVPEELGRRVEVILLPVESPVAEYSEWTDEEWEAFSLRGIADSRDDVTVDWEEHFGIKNR
jgi:hypothetical protein